MKQINKDVVYYHIHVSACVWEIIKEEFFDLWKEW